MRRKRLALERLLCTRLQAHEIDPSSPEPEQASASLQHELGQVDAALHLLQSSMQKWWHPDKSDELDDDCQDATANLLPKGAPRRRPGAAGIQSELSDEDGSDAEEGSDGGMPSYEFRLEACKLLIELDKSTDTAIEVRCPPRA